MFSYCRTTMGVLIHRFFLQLYHNKESYTSYMVVEVLQPSPSHAIYTYICTTRPILSMILALYLFSKEMCFQVEKLMLYCGKSILFNHVFVYLIDCGVQISLPPPPLFTTLLVIYTYSDVGKLFYNRSLFFITIPQSWAVSIGH